MRRSYQSAPGSDPRRGIGYGSSWFRRRGPHGSLEIEPRLWVASAVSLAIHGLVLLLLAGSSEPRRQLGLIGIELRGGVGGGRLHGPGDRDTGAVGEQSAGVPDEGGERNHLEARAPRPTLPAQRPHTSSSTRRAARARVSEASSVERSRRARLVTEPAHGAEDDGSDAPAGEKLAARREVRNIGQTGPTSGALRGDVGPSGPASPGVGAGAGGGGGSDLQASCLACPVPTYPMRARRRGWEGVVDLSLRLDAVGRVSNVSVARSSGFKALDEAAAAAARRSRFRVSGRGGVSGTIGGRMRYRFELGGG